MKETEEQGQCLAVDVRPIISSHNPLLDRLFTDRTICTGGLTGDDLEKAIEKRGVDIIKTTIIVIGSEPFPTRESQER